MSAAETYLAIAAERDAAPVSPIATQETVEEIAREKLAAWMIAHSIATGHGDTFDDLLGELSAALSSAERRTEELVRERDEAIRQQIQLEAEGRALESRLASLTGQVEDMRAAGGHALDTLRVFLDTFGDLGDRVTQADIEDWRAAFSLPVLPTTGDGGGLTGEALREETTCTCGAGHGSGEPHTDWCEHLAPTGRETSGEET